MKHRLLFLVGIFYAQYLSASCAPTQPGTSVWSIAAQNNLKSMTVDSLIDAFAINSSTDFDGSFTVLDTLLDKVCMIESQAEQLAPSVMQAQTTFDADLSKVCVLAEHIEVVDYMVSFTALQALKNKLCSTIDVISSELGDVENQIVEITDNEIAYTQSIESKLHAINGDVITINSILEQIPNQIPADADLINSQLDDIASRLNPIESKMNVLDTVIVNGFAGTFTALDLNLQKACAIDSLADEVAMVPMVDLSGVYTALGELAQTMCTIESKVDDLNTVLSSDESLLHVLNSNIDSTLGLICATESKLAPLVSVTDVVESILDSAATDLSGIDVKIDATIVKTELAESLTEVIDSRIMQINTDLASNIDELITVESQLDVINSKITGIDVSDSKINGVNSKIDSNISQAFTIESVVDVAASLIERISMNVNAPETILSKVCVIESNLFGIDSALDVLNASLYTTDSKLDIIIPIEVDSISKLQRIESTIAGLPFNLSAVDALNSTLDIIEPLVCTIESKLEHLPSLISVLNMKAMVLHSDFQQTWTILDAINNTLITDQSLVDGISSKLDSINIANDVAGTYSVIASIQQKENAVESKISVVESIVCAIQPIDLTGVYTALDQLRTTVNINDSKVDDINSNVDSIDFALGFPIYSRDLPKTISVPGLYYFAENLVYTPAGTGTNAITIATSNVTIDMDGRSLTQLNGKSGTANTKGIVANSNLSNIWIKNGTIHDLRSKGLSFNSGCSNIIVDGVSVINVGTTAGVGFAGDNNLDFNFNCSQCIIRNCYVSDGAQTGISIGGPTSPCFDVVVSNCMAENCTEPGIIGRRFGRIFIKDCTVNSDGQSGLVLDGNSNLFVIERCLANSNQGPGLSLFNFSGSSPQKGTIRFCVSQNNQVNGVFMDESFFVDVLSCTCIGNDLNGVGLQSGSVNNYIAFNSCIQNDTNFLEVGGASPNTYLGNFAFNSTAVGSPDNTNYNLITNITGKFATVAQNGAFPTTEPTEWMNINMLP